MAETPQVFAAFTGSEMLRESGRLPFAVLWPFVRAGHHVSVQGGLRERLEAFYADRDGGLPPTARLSLSIPGVAYDAPPPQDPGRCIHVFDRAQPDLHGRVWQRRLRIGFDLFAVHRLRAPLIAPYAMHPAQALEATAERLQVLRATPRRLRLLFAGDSKGYLRNRVRYPGPKMPRAEVLATLRSDLGDAVAEVSGTEEIEALSDGGYANRVVLSDSGSGIAPAQWLPTLARADFFLCPPGIVMPMCHNVIEAMAVGTIPLIGYPEWFHPRLEHQRNCIAFDGRDDLIAKVHEVLAMPREEIARLRSAVIEHYEAFLRPEALVHRIGGRPERDLDILVYTELNMARHADRLGPQSVLMRGPDIDGPWRRLGRFLDRLKS